MKKLIITFIGIYLVCASVLAQDSFDPDELLKQARTLIFDKKYDEGRKVAFRALEKYPNYADILILVGRSYAWEGKNDSASIYLERAIVASPEYTDGYVAYLDNLFWADDLTKAGAVLSRAKSNLGPPVPDEIIYRESRLLYYQEQYKEAFNLVDPLFKKGFKTEGLLGYMKNLERFRMVNAVGATYDYDSFQGDISPWHTCQSTVVLEHNLRER